MKKGQAALEFLSTYGFAFLIILVMIGALSYFGVLSPNKLIPNRCTMPAQFSCFEFISARNASAPYNASINVVIINQLGNTVNFNVTVTGSNASSQYGYGNCGFTPSQVVNGQKAIISCNMNTSASGVGPSAFPAKGEKIKVALDFKYTELGRNYEVPIRGEILSTLT